MNEAIALDMQDKSAHISSLNKTPVSIIQEYAAKHRIVPQYNLIFNGIKFTEISFKYSLTLEEYEAVGEGSSKKEAKHVAASNLLKQMIDEKPELLDTEFKQWDFENHVVSPFDNNIKVNAIGQLNDLCAQLKLGLPEFNFVREEGQAHAKLFTISCHVAKMTKVATHKTKKQAKHLSAVQMIKKLMSIEESLGMESNPQAFDYSEQILNKVESMKFEQVQKTIKKGPPIDENIENYHLLFKQAEWNNTETLNMIVEQYKENNEFVFHEPFKILQTIVDECGMNLTSKTIDKDLIDSEDNLCLILAIENIYPPVYGSGMGKTVEKAQQKAAKELLTNICLLSI